MTTDQAKTLNLPLWQAFRHMSISALRVACYDYEARIAEAKKGERDVGTSTTVQDLQAIYDVAFTMWQERV